MSSWMEVALFSSVNKFEPLGCAGQNKMSWVLIWGQIDGLVQERYNSIAYALELRLSCTYPLKLSKG